MTAENKNDATRTKNRLTLLALFGVFAGPVLGAYGALSLGWFTPASVNKGELLSGAPSLAELPLRRMDGVELPQAERQGPWRLVYALGTDCAAACEHNLYTLHQVWSALGKEQDRVQPVFLSAGALGQAEKIKPVFGQLQWWRLGELKPELAQGLHFVATEAKGRLYLVDPRGVVALSYTLAEEPQASALIGKNVLKDIKHLLKLSNIG
ncbi:MAG: SCO family protein [Gammaproteobacteria bacterium]|nr:SCO family protein [Gammaproteobacteria bacterium]